MMSYIAFKCLQIYGDKVYSPQYYASWNEVYVPFLGRLSYSLSVPSLEGKQGVYAGTLCEALRYLDTGCGIFLAAPDPDAETEIGTMGWRSTCAIVIGEITSLRDAASLIIASHQAGYPQIHEIVRWARSVLSLREPSVHELVERSAEVQEMIRAAACYTVRNTPIKVIEGDQPPTLASASRCHSQYDSQNLCIKVGENWLFLRSLVSSKQP